MTLTDYALLAATALGTWLFGCPFVEDEPEPDVGKLVADHYGRRGMEAWHVEHNGQHHIIAFTEERGCEAGAMAARMVTAMAFEGDGV